MIHIEKSAEQAEHAQTVQIQEMHAVGQVLGQTISPEASRSVAYIVGTINTGYTALVDDGPSLSGLSYLYVVARDRADSLSALTFTLEQVEWTAVGYLVKLIGKITCTPGNPTYSVLALPDKNTNSTLRVVATAVAAYPSGVDNFVLNVTGY